jgi:Resolvase, N terminal domain
MRAAIYLRQSKDREGNELAVDRQREDLLKLCAARGWSTAEYMDNDFSASVRMPGQPPHALGAALPVLGIAEHLHRVGLVHPRSRWGGWPVRRAPASPGAWSRAERQSA